MEIPTIATFRLALRGFSMDDVDELQQILGEPDVLRYFPNPAPPPKEKVESFIAAQIDHWEKRGFGWWAVESISSKRLIGWSGLQYLPETDEIEVGYLLSKDQWGKGLATEGAAASLQFGFESLGLVRIVALVHPENVASQRVIEKLGMLFTKRAEYFGIDLNHYQLESEVYRDRSKARTAA